MFSILIPTYNHKISILVNTINLQAKKLDIPFEVIVVDDASTLYKKENAGITQLENVTYKKLEENKGRSSARNLLTQLAKYDQLLFLDADVFPKTDLFLNTYIQHIDKDLDIICGGIDYEKKKPGKPQRLRYKYGIAREVKQPENRNKKRYLIVSANLWIKKEVYIHINSNLSNFYGSDLLLSENIRKMKYRVLHIDNPTLHLGLETSEVYLNKAKKLQHTITTLEKENSISKGLTGIQRVYCQLKKYGLIGIANFGIGIIYPLIKRQLTSSRPSLFLFDLYKLYHYINSKKNA